MPESPREKIVRHIKEHEWDPRTIAKGVSYLFERYTRGSEEGSELILVKVVANFLDIPGLQVIDYELRLPKAEIVAGKFYTKVPIRIYLFPTDISPRCEVTLDAVGISTRSHLLNLPYRKALEFTGPTFKGDIRLPNNGFYHDGQTMVPFQDTNPSGQRRGAIAFKEDGSVRLLTDEEKWDIVRADYNGVSTLVGTSYWFTPDTEDNAEPVKSKEPAYYSYLFQGSSNPEIMGFILSSKLASRTPIVQALNDAMVRGMIPEYIAVEMELKNSCCLVKNDSRRSIFGGEGFSTRCDHYYLEL